MTDPTRRTTALPRRSLLAVPLALGALAAVGPAVTTTPAVAAPPARPLRVMSFNIHHGAGRDDVLDLEHVARVIADSDADVIGLQEVDRHWGTRSAYLDEAAWLGERLGMHHAYGANLDLDPEPGRTERRQYGTAVLSRHPILSSTNHLLTSIPYPERPTEQRGLLRTTINVRGVRVEMCCTHLDHQRAEQRISQTREIVDLLAGTTRPTFVVGDLNAEPGTTEVQQLIDAGFADPFDGVPDNATYPVPVATKRIDYVLGRRAERWRDATVIATDASDHLPLHVSADVRR